MNARKQSDFLSHQRSLRGPAWRSQAAGELSDLHDPRVISAWDPLTLDLAKYYALGTGGAAGMLQAAEKYPQLAAAILLQGEPAKTDLLKLLVLADAPLEAMAKKVGLEAAIVDVWEKLFFDVRGLRHSVAWVSAQVIEAERKAGNSALAARMKLALTAGIEGVNAILAMDEGAPIDEADRLFQRKLALDLKLEDAVSMTIDSDKNRMKYVELNVKLLISQNQIELAEKKLAADCAAGRVKRRRRTPAVREAEAAHVRELQHDAYLAGQKAATCRIAESSLSQLAWGPAQPRPELSPSPLSSALPSSVSLKPEPVTSAPLKPAPLKPGPLKPGPLPAECPGSVPPKSPAWADAGPEYDPLFDPNTDPFDTDLDTDVDAAMLGLEFATQGGI